jgi:phosphopantetheine--protein transferase-like protein
MRLSSIGIGIDVVKINRFKSRSYESHKSFYKKIFNKSEIDYCLKFKEPYKHFAGKFAIKEAVKKSISEERSLICIKTGHSNSKPIVSIVGNKYRFLVSVSHEQDIAVAVVISEKVK